MHYIHKIFLSFFGLGFLPKAPGTFGTLGAIPVVYLISQLYISNEIFILCLILMTTLTCYITEVYQKKHKLHDPQWIVIDEVLGFLTAWIFYPQWEIINIFVLFISFRFFDIIKIWPASYFDRMKHGAGTILDDIVSGIYAGIFTLLVNNFRLTYF